MSDERTGAQWVRVVVGDETLAMIRLPLSFDVVGLLAQMWPGASLTASKSIDDTVRDVKTWDAAYDSSQAATTRRMKGAGDSEG